MDIPSEILLKYGKPLAGSCYKVEQAQLVLDGSVEECSFEVMYSEGGEIYVVCLFASINDCLRVFVGQFGGDIKMGSTLMPPKLIQNLP